MKKCLVFGSLNLDYFYSVDHILNSKETQSARQMQCFCGGKGMNQAVALSQGGASVHFAGCLGQASSLLSDTLAQYHIDNTYVQWINLLVTQLFKLIAQDRMPSLFIQEAITPLPPPRLMKR